MKKNESKTSLLNKLIRFCLEQKLIVFLITFLVIAWGISVAPFDWKIGGLPRNPVPVDAIPDIGDNLQIVFTEWTGRSPQDVEDQITYPLTTALLGVPGVKTIRSYSLFGFSTINIIFNEDVDFYWSRTRILEKMNSLPAGTLPEEVQPALGPDATALGQIYWYNLEGRDEKGNPTGGWDLDELRTVQDWYVRYALLSSEGVSEVASVGGFVKEYQVDVNPDALRAYNVDIQDVFNAVKMSNLDVGARTIEVNQVEYVIRGIGFIKTLEDLESSVIKTRDNLPVRVKDVAEVTLGPFVRRGALNKEGSQVAGGVVIVRYGYNPLKVIQNIKEKIKEIAPSLPSKILPDGTVSKLSIVPFYDRTGLINETLFTLNTALIEEILITIIVVLLAVMHFRSSLLISALLPLAVLLSFIAMKIFGVEANIVSLSGIAIAIGAMVAMGIFVCENILKSMKEMPKGMSRLEMIYKATSEIGSAVLTASATTVVSFLPVFTMIGPEGKLFKPLAFTKTFALISSIIIALTILPPLAHLLFVKKEDHDRLPKILRLGSSFFLILIAILSGIFIKWWIGGIFLYLGMYSLFAQKFSARMRNWLSRAINIVIIVLITYVLTDHWLPLGPEKGFFRNFIFISLFIGGLMTLFHLFLRGYSPILKWSLNHKLSALSIPLIFTAVGFLAWIGIPKATAWLPESLKDSKIVSNLSAVFPGFGKEFMPPLDEGSFLFMPITMPHAGTGEVEEILSMQNMAIQSIPEIDETVGKWGRAETALDPAPISMFETIINYKPKYIENQFGKRLRFKFNPNEKDYFRSREGEPLPAPDNKPYKVSGEFERDEKGQLIPDPKGIPFRLWRPPLTPKFNPGREVWDGINNSNDIWKEIEKISQLPGVTSAPKLQPIAARIVMLQSGMRAPMGIKIRGPDLKAIEQVGYKIEKFLKEIPSVYAPAVIADRIISKPYLEIEIDRTAIARYGLMINEVQDIIEIALGGKKITTTVEGRERFPVRIRYLRELRDNVEEINRVLVSSSSGEQIPLTEIAKIRFVRGPQVIKSEDTFLVGYVLFDMNPGYAEVDVVEDVRDYLNQKIASGEFKLPQGVTYTFAGTYENQIRAQKKLSVILPLALFIILMILYFQFKSFATSLIVYTSIMISWAGGFILIWFYAQGWFLDFSIFGTSMRDLFQVHPVNLSIAVWVGFLALFGIASDNGVVIASCIRDKISEKKPDSIKNIREAVLEGSVRRIRPALMTSVTTILALLPVLSSTGKGSDILVPMAIPSFGGMIIALLTVIVVPVLYSWVKETSMRIRMKMGLNNKES